MPPALQHIATSIMYYRDKVKYFTASYRMAHFTRYYSGVITNITERLFIELGFTEDILDKINFYSVMDRIGSIEPSQIE